MESHEKVRKWRGESTSEWSAERPEFKAYKSSETDWCLCLLELEATLNTCDVGNPKKAACFDG